MSGSIVLQLSKGLGDRALLQLVKAPNIADDDIGIMFFDCDPTSLPSVGPSDTVTAHGQILLRSLMASHQVVNNALMAALGINHETCCPIYLQLKALPSVEAYCWEALCKEDGNFIALDNRWPIARLASAPNLTGRAIVSFKFPLRIMVVLSALGLDPTQEWNHLYQAVCTARQGGLPVALHVGTSHEELDAHIRQVAGIEGNEFLSHFAVRSALDLTAEINGFAPNLLHFFCHGSTTYGKPRLLLATMNDYERSSIELTMNDLLNSSGVRNSWLVVLNCCEGSAPVKDAHSLSYKLVAGGVYAAIGMKEEVAEIDAVEFTSRLYPDLLDMLRRGLGAMNPHDIVTLEWVHAMRSPRDALNRSHGADHTWTLPLLYVQPEPLRVRLDSATESDDWEQQARDRVIEEALALLPPDKKAIFKAELDAVRAGI